MTSECEGSRPNARGVRTPAVLVWLRLMRIVNKVERAAAAQFRCLGLTPAQFDVLAQVGAKEGSTQQELADALLVTKGNVTQLLDRMETSGLLRRAPEGRTKRVCLTEAGRALRARVVPEHESMIARHFDALSPDEQRELLRLLRRLEQSFTGMDWRS